MRLRNILHIVAISFLTFLGNSLFAEAQGHWSDALLASGRKHLNGDGEQKNAALAYRDLYLAGEAGNVEAQYYVGRMLQAGEGVKKDPRMAADWLLRAAQQRQTMAMGLYAVQLLGDGGDEAEALSWLVLAAYFNPLQATTTGRLATAANASPATLKKARALTLHWRGIWVRHLGAEIIPSYLKVAQPETWQKEDALSTALALMEAGKYPEAKKDLDVWLAAHPGDEDGLLDRGYCRRRTKDDDGALSDYRAAAKADPSSGFGDYAVARLLDRRENAKDATRSYHAALAAKVPLPPFVVTEIWLSLGSLAYKAYQFENAAKAFSNYLQLVPKDRDVLFLRGLTYSVMKPERKALACKDMKAAQELGYDLTDFKKYCP